MKPPIPDRAADPVGDAPLVNVPNALTLLRVLCVPVLAVLLAVDGGELGPARDAAAILFVLASVTDLVDGAIARRYGLVTTFGKVADPIADKALTGVALIGLSLLGDLSWWVTGIILVREIGVTLLRFWVIEHGVIPASRGGKLKTVAQTVAIAMYLADVPPGLVGDGQRHRDGPGPGPHGGDRPGLRGSGGAPAADASRDRQQPGRPPCRLSRRAWWRRCWSGGSRSRPVSPSRPASWRRRSPRCRAAPRCCAAGSWPTRPTSSDCSSASPTRSSVPAWSASRWRRPWRAVPPIGSVPTSGSAPPASPARTPMTASRSGRSGSRWPPRPAPSRGTFPSRVTGQPSDVRPSRHAGTWSSTSSSRRLRGYASGARGIGTRRGALGPVRNLRRARAV